MIRQYRVANTTMTTTILSQRRNTLAMRYSLHLHDYQDSSTCLSHTLCALAFLRLSDGCYLLWRLGGGVDSWAHWTDDQRYKQRALGGSHVLLRLLLFAAVAEKVETVTLGGIRLVLAATALGMFDTMYHLYLG